MKKFRIAILASGGGSNAEKIMQYFSQHQSIEVAVVITNNAAAKVIERAKAFGVETQIVGPDVFSDENTMLGLLKAFGVTHLVLAGFLLLIPMYLVRAFHDRIINIHPALLPKFGGKGMYGLRVHQAVKAAGESETGITIHLVNEHYDEGRVLFQTTCPISETHTAEEIAGCVLALEHEHYPRVIEKWILQTASI